MNETPGVIPTLALEDLRWQRVRLTLVSTRVHGEAPYLCTVVESVLKRVHARCGGVPNGGSILWHLIGRRPVVRPKEGEHYPLEVLLCGVDVAWSQGWRTALAAYFAPGGGAENLALADLGPVEERSYESVLAEVLALPAEGELCLDFLSPLSFKPPPRKPRTHLDREALLALFQARLELLFGAPVACPPGAEDDPFEVLPYYWHYTDPKHTSKSQPGTTQYIQGCVGKLYLKGRFDTLLPLLYLGSELHAGTKRSNAQGYYRLLPAGAPFFQPSFPNANGLAAACRDVLERHDNAAATLSEAPGEQFDEVAFASNLAEELRAGTYEPAPHIAFTVQKKDGSERLVEQPRPRDLVVQKYLLKTIGPTFDRMFEEGALGFRKGGSRQEAARRIQSAIRDGYQFVVESDVEDFFPSVDLDRLAALLDRCLPQGDRIVREVLWKIVANGYILNGHLLHRSRGLAQGNPVSPVLANLYLDAFDEEIQRHDVRLVRYGDDFVILTRTRAEAEQILCTTRDTLAAWGLAVNLAKTAVRPVEEGFEFLGVRFSAGDFRVEPEETPQRYKKPLYITEPYLFLALDGDAIDIRRQGQVVESIPLRRVSEIMVLGQAVFSTALLGRCTADGIPFTVASATGYYMTTVKPDSRRYYDIAHRHALRHAALTDTEKLAVAKELAAHKIRNYHPWLSRRPEPPVRTIAGKIVNLAARIDTAATVDEVRGFEAAAAKEVYACFNLMIPDPAFRLVRRLRRPPDRINSLLNFGYYLLFSQVNATVRAVGLNPYLGFLHSDENRYESLACDIEELFRSRIDRLVVRLVNWKKIQAMDFNDTPKGHYLNHTAARRFILEFEAEMARKEGRTGLSVKENIYLQVQRFKKWALEGAGIELYGSSG